MGVLQMNIAGGGAAVTKFPTKYLYRIMRREFIVLIIGTSLVVSYLIPYGIYTLCSKK